MAEFLTTKDSLSQIERVIRTADRQLTIITPFVQISEDFKRRLRDADDRSVRIRLVCRTAKLNATQTKALAEYENLTVFDDPKLHAKCFVNERGLVLTSLNFYEASEQNNEMGVYLDPERDKQAYDDAVREAESIIKAATPFEIAGSPKRGRKRKAPKSAGRFGFGRKKGTTASAAPTGGYCLRCGTATEYDPKKPYCGKCFRQWLRFKNPTYADDHCHGCGAEEAEGFSMEKPECYPCYKRHSKRAA